MAKVSMYDPAADAYREITDTVAAEFVTSAKAVEQVILAQPSVVKVSMFDPSVVAYREISKASAMLFIDSAKDVAQKLSIPW